MPLKTAACFDKIKSFLKEQGSDVVKKIDSFTILKLLNLKGSNLRYGLSISRT